MIKRYDYINEIKKFIDVPLVKILAGVRRCGKSTILDMIKEELISNGKDEDSIISRKYNEIQFEDMTAKEMYSDLTKDFKEGQRYYLFLDELQEIKGWEKVVNDIFDFATSMRFGKFEFDINDDGYFDYVLWAWKGNYLNLGAGAKLGIYERWEYSDEIWKVDKDNAMTMTLKLEHKTKGTLFNWQPKDKQWWITGFDPKTQNVNRDNLKATYSVEFANIDMYEDFKNEWKYDSIWNFGTYKKPVLTLDWI